MYASEDKLEKNKNNFLGFSIRVLLLSSGVLFVLDYLVEDRKALEEIINLGNVSTNEESGCKLQKKRF